MYLFVFEWIGTIRIWESQQLGSLTIASMLSLWYKWAFYCGCHWCHPSSRFLFLIASYAFFVCVTLEKVILVYVFIGVMCGSVLFVWMKLFSYNLMHSFKVKVYAQLIKFEVVLTFELQERIHGLLLKFWRGHSLLNCLRIWDCYANVFWIGWVYWCFGNLKFLLNYQSLTAK